MSFANPLGVGLTSDGEYVDIELVRPIASKEAVRRLNETSANGIEVVSFVEIPDDKKSGGMAIVAAADYLVSSKKEAFPEEWKNSGIKFMSQEAVCVVKKTKKSEKEVDILPMIHQFEVRDNGIFMQLAAGSEQNLKPGLVMEAFCDYVGYEYCESDCHFHRLEMYAKGTDDKSFISLESLGKEIL